MCVADWLPETEQKDALSGLCSDGAPIMLGCMRSHLHAKFHVSQIQHRDCIKKVMLINASIRHEVTSACQASCISDTVQGLHKKSYVDKCYGWCGCHWLFSRPSCTKGSLVGYFVSVSIFEAVLKFQKML